MKTVECSKGLSLETGAQLEEKKTSEIVLSGQHSNEPEKRQKPEEAVEEGAEPGQVEPGGGGALPESTRARAEAGFLPDMVRRTHYLVQPVGSSFSQRALHIA